MISRPWIALATLCIATATDLGQSCLRAVSAEAPVVIRISAKRFEYSPREITLKKGVPSVLQLTSEDRTHGFNIPSMNLRADIVPGKVTELKVTAQKTGEFDFFCDVFCGSGHEGMGGTINVTD